MRIAIDAREMCGRPTGVGTYLANLMREWQRMPEAAAHEWMLYAPPQTHGDSYRSPAIEVFAGAASAVGARFRLREVPGGGGTLWEQRDLAGALRLDQPDLLFAPGYTAPLSVRLPIALTIHDVSFFARPEWFHWREGLRRRFLTRRSARKARLVLTVSQFSKQEIVRYTGVAASRIRAIYSGVARHALPAAPCPRDPVVLFVGSIFNRRRVPDLIKAFSVVAAAVPAARLEIVGDNRTHPFEDLDRLAASLGVGDRVRLRSYVGEDDLPALYRQASVFAFLSEYEGFGFTPLEALAHGAPPVVLDTPVAREIYKDAAVYVPMGDVEGTAAALRRLLENEPARAALVAAGGRVLARYTWANAARETLVALEETGRGRI